MDPRFFLHYFHGLRASRLGHKRKEKNSVHNLPYGPRTRLIRGTYCDCSTKQLFCFCLAVYCFKVLVIIVVVVR